MDTWTQKTIQHRRTHHTTSTGNHTTSTDIPARFLQTTAHILDMLKHMLKTRSFSMMEWIDNLVDIYLLPSF
ncbi:hypothetical protein N9L68_07935 [bacterium]|nr:hypothetical protein [bacterium]